MASLTAKGLRIPDLGDSPDVPRDIINLGQDVDRGLHKVLTNSLVLEGGQAGQIRAGRLLTPADFTAAGMALIGLWTMNGSLTADSSGNGFNLVAKAGTEALGPGLMGGATDAVVFTQNIAQVLYLSSASNAAGELALRIRTGSWGFWQRMLRRGQSNGISKQGATDNAFFLGTDFNGLATGGYSSNGTAIVSHTGYTDTTDERWHFICASHDGGEFKLFVDGNMELRQSTTGLINPGVRPFNIGGSGADAATASSLATSGRYSNLFVSSDCMSEEQHRMLYAAAIAHGLQGVGPAFAAALPSGATARVRRRKRGGGVLSQVTDFPVPARRIYNCLTSAGTDSGADGANATTNAGTGSITLAAGADGAKNSGIWVAGAHGGQSATDTGLPSGQSARSFGGWFLSNSLTAATYMGWGTLTTGDARLGQDAAGNAVSQSAGDLITGPYVADGRWHHIVMVEDPAPFDGVMKRRMYFDGRILSQAISTVLNSIVLAGANRFRMGAAPDGTLPMQNGAFTKIFVYPGVLTPDQVRNIYFRSQLELPPSVVSAGEFVEYVDTTNVYVVLDQLEPQDKIELVVHT